MDKIKDILFKRIYFKNNILINFFIALLSVAGTFVLAINLDIVAVAFLIVIIVPIFYISIKTSAFVRRFCLVDLLLCIIISVTIGHKLGGLIFYFDMSCPSYLINIFRIAFSLYVIPISLLLVLFIRIYFLSIKNNLYKYISFFIAIMAIGGIFFIFLPSQTFFMNIDEYGFSYITFIKAQFGAFLIVLLVVPWLLTFLKGKVYSFVLDLLFGIHLTMYVQYIFLNKYLGELNGNVYDWRAHLLFSIIDAIIYLIIMILPLLCDVILKNRNVIRINISLSIFIMLIQIIGIILLAITAPDIAYSSNSYSVDNSKFYEVGNNNNTIVFILDAVDNSFIKELMNDESEVFNQYNDYTVFTNTCSVYDNTGDSIPQMLSGTGFNGKIYDYDTFYSRLKENGYKVNIYNYSTSYRSPNLYEYFDNYYAETSSKDGDYNFVIYKNIISNSARLTVFQVLPQVLKGIINTNDILFKFGYHCGANYMYENDEFLNNLDIIKSDDMNSCFIVYHIDGAHLPSDKAFAEDTEECLEIIGKYMDNLKDLGLYDSASIVITSDHGKHDSPDIGSFFASTPMLMVKKAGITYDEMQVSSAPVYFTDLLATILDISYLYDYDEDAKSLGTSVFYIPEDEDRERIWYDHIGNGEYYKVTYTGDTSDLENAIENGNYETIWK